MAQPAGSLLARQLVRPIPFASQKIFINGSVANNGTLVSAFDISVVVSDANQLIGTTPPVNAGAEVAQPAVGPYLDAFIFSTGAGSFLIEFGVDSSASYRALSTAGVPASQATNISGLRITARFCRLTFTNTSGGAAAVEFGAFVRST